MNSKQKKILLGPSSFAEIDKTPVERLVKAGFKVIANPYGRKLKKSELLELLREDIEGLIAGLEPLDREVLGKSKLKVISRCGSGMSNVDQRAAAEMGIGVFSTPYGPTAAVAELTLGVLLSLLRMVPLMDRGLHAGEWIKKVGEQLEGKTVAIVGFGRIGHRLAELLEPFHVKIAIVDPLVREEVQRYPILSLEDAIQKADVVTLHLSGEKTVIGEAEFRLMKKGSYLLNAARGGLVDEDALVKALQIGRIKGAWLDTYSKEPYRGPLAEFQQVILTPHVGSYTRECRRSMEMESVDNLLNFFQVPENL